jgi:hypothetical protein
MDLPFFKLILGLSYTKGLQVQLFNNLFYAWNKYIKYTKNRDNTFTVYEVRDQQVAEISKLTWSTIIVVLKKQYSESNKVLGERISVYKLA